VQLDASRTRDGHVRAEAGAQMRVRVLLAGVVAQLARGRHRARLRRAADLEAADDARRVVVGRLARLWEDLAEQIDTVPKAADRELALFGR
jgi:GTP1/Obg family GTP-binding protein